MALRINHAGILWFMLLSKPDSVQISKNTIVQCEADNIHIAVFRVHNSFFSYNINNLPSVLGNLSNKDSSNNNNDLFYNMTIASNFFSDSRESCVYFSKIKMLGDYIKNTTFIDDTTHLQRFVRQTAIARF